MFAQRFFAGAYFAPVYWTKAGAAGPLGTLRNLMLLGVGQ